jgi:hypothetical protein
MMLGLGFLRAEVQVSVRSLGRLGELRHFKNIDPMLLQQLDTSAVLYEEAGFPPGYDNTGDTSCKNELATGYRSARSLGARLQSAVDCSLLQTLVISREFCERGLLSVDFRVSLSRITGCDLLATCVRNDCANRVMTAPTE